VKIVAISDLHGFRPIVPGTGGLLAFALRRSLSQGLDGLARLAEQA